MFCQKCGSEISKKDAVCSNCGTTLTSTNKNLVAKIVIFSIGVFLFISLVGILTTDSIDSVEKQVAQDQIDQYNIAKKSGDKIQICVQAGLVEAAFLQAKDETNYNKWQAVKKADCKAAGLPDM